MIEGLVSVVGIVFLLSVVLPGGVALVVAGRPRGEFSFWRALFYGLIFFALALFICLFLRIDGVPRTVHFLNAMASLASRGEMPSEGLTSLYYVFTVSYLLGFIAGWLELIMKAGVLSSGTGWALRKRLRWKSRIACQLPILIRKSDLPQDIFIAFRRAGVRPYVRVVFRDGGSLQGECLRYSWNGSESLLIRDADHSDRASWVRVQDLERLDFLNLMALQNAERDSGERSVKQEKKWRRKVLNDIVPGLGDETFPERT